MKLRTLACAFVAIGLWSAAPRGAPQAIDAGAIFRIFLKTGQALPSYGESAIVGDRVVFTLLVGAVEARTTTQLMSLPVESVDIVRTRRYANAMRARHYAATRGEVDYAAITQEVQRALSQLPAIQDPKRRLALAEDAKRRLLAWSAGSYGYRALDVRELASLFDEVIAELRAAAGERQFSVDLRSGPDDSPPEPILGAPTMQESIYLALYAARAADSEDERLAVLRAAESATSDARVADDLRALVRRELGAEASDAAAYATLLAGVRARAEEARRMGDVAGVESAIEALRTGDRALGTRRPQSVGALARELDAMLEVTRTYRAALDRYARVRTSLLQYERTVRPVMSGLDGLTPVFSVIRDSGPTAYERLERAGVRLTGYAGNLKSIVPPVDLADVHATLESAVRMADYACARRRLAVSTGSEAMAREASTAAAGAMLLAGLAREQLVARLYPPKIQ